MREPLLVVAAIVAALVGGGGLGGYFGARRSAAATEVAASTSKPHEQLSAEAEAFKVFMEQARIELSDMRARLAACEQKHAESERVRVEQSAEIATLRARVAHLEAVAAAAGSTLGSVHPGSGGGE